MDEDEEEGAFGGRLYDLRLFAQHLEDVSKTCVEIRVGGKGHVHGAKCMRKRENKCQANVRRRTIGEENGESRRGKERGIGHGGCSIESI